MSSSGGPSPATSYSISIPLETTVRGTIRELYRLGRSGWGLDLDGAQIAVAQVLRRGGPCPALGLATRSHAEQLAGERIIDQSPHLRRRRSRVAWWEETAIESMAHDLRDPAGVCS